MSASGSEPQGFFVRLPPEVIRAVKVDAAQAGKPLWRWMLEAATQKLPPKVQKELTEVIHSQVTHSRPE